MSVMSDWLEELKNKGAIPNYWNIDFKTGTDTETATEQFLKDIGDLTADLSAIQDRGLMSSETTYYIVSDNGDTISMDEVDKLHTALTAIQPQHLEILVVSKHLKILDNGDKEEYDINYTGNGDAGNNYIYHNDGDNTITGDAGNDRIFGGAGIDSIDGGIGNDHIFGGDGIDDISGGEGNDWIEGNDGDDKLYGDSGNDYIKGGVGIDDISGGAGDDTINGGNDGDHIDGDDGNDIIQGGGGNDTISGGAGDDTLYGNDGNDYIYGNSGNDTISGGAGDDTINGGAGNDHLYGGAGNGGLGENTFVYTSINDGADIIHDFKIGANADVLNLANLLSYQSGDVLGNFIKIDSDQNGTTLNINANGGDIGTNVSITLVGVTGVDLSTMISDGNLIALNLNSNNNTWTGTDDDNFITSGGGNDRIFGGAGDDTIDGDDGNDYILGGNGDDYIRGGDGNDWIYGGAGDDGINGGNDGDHIWGDDDNDIIDGNGGDDTIDGGNGDDDISGGGSDDRIWGGDGNDRIWGATGNDTLTGGAGKDTFVYHNTSDGNDVIVDFKTGTDADSDVLNLVDLMSFSRRGNNILDDFIEIIDENGNTILNIDVDGYGIGNGSGYDDISITLEGVTGVDLDTMIADGNIVLA